MEAASRAFSTSSTTAEAKLGATTDPLTFPATFRGRRPMTCESGILTWIGNPAWAALSQPPRPTRSQKAWQCADLDPDPRLHFTSIWPPGRNLFHTPFFSPSSASNYSTRFKAKTTAKSPGAPKTRAICDDYTREETQNLRPQDSGRFSLFGGKISSAPSRSICDEGFPPPLLPCFASAGLRIGGCRGCCGKKSAAALSFEENLLDGDSSPLLCTSVVALLPSSSLPSFPLFPSRLVYPGNIPVLFV